MLALNSSGAHYSTGDIVLWCVLALVFGFIGYRASHRFRTVVGVTPWRIPSIVWAAICFVLQPIGVILEWVAQFTTRPAIDIARHAAPAGVGTAPRTVPAAPISAPSLPAVPPAPAPPRFAPPRDASGRNDLFGWYPDVTGRHELRYWDGKRWSDHVRDAGVAGTDPLGE